MGAGIQTEAAIIRAMATPVIPPYDSFPSLHVSCISNSRELEKQHDENREIAYEVVEIDQR